MITSGEKSVRFWSGTAQRAKETGFTLVELLAVSILLLALAFLVLPILVRAKQKSIQANCQSNLRHVGWALQIYADANREFLPGPVFALANPAYDIDSTNQFVWFLTEELGSPRPSTTPNVARPLLCPAQQCQGACPSPTSERANYILNEVRNSRKALPGPPFGRPIPPIIPPMNLSAVASSASPASCFVMADADKGNVNPTLPGWNGLPYQPVHGRVRNQLFFDWHVAAGRL
jgi:prepilin-type processing-associated H-X9-DG protein